MTGIVLIGVRIAADRDPRKVAGEAQHALERPSTTRLEHRGLPNYEPKVRWEKGRERPGKATPEGVIREPHKLEIELRIGARDLPMAVIHAVAFIPMSKVLQAAAAGYEDVLYVEAVRERD